MQRYLSGFMQVYYGIDALPKFKNAVITIGTFDGVHHGHQIVISALRNEAKRINGVSVIITFDPHPRKIVQPHTQLQLINTLDEKIGLLEKKEVDYLVVVPFTPEFAALSAAEYVQQFIVEKFSPAAIIIGYDHHFGKNREGNFQLLQSEQERWGFRLIEIPPHVLSQITISSTKIRDALSAGNVQVANQLLGYNFFFNGTVVKGDAIGRKLGYPTANLLLSDSDKICIADGVYAVYATVNGHTEKGLLSIGTRPTLKNKERKIEVYLIGFNEEIYGARLTVTVVYFLRKQVKFESLELLKEQMKKDEFEAALLFNDSSS